MPETLDPPVTPVPATPTPPASSAPPAAGSPISESFDASFPDDGLDAAPPAPAKEGAAASPPPQSGTKPEIPKSGEPSGAKDAPPDAPKPGKEGEGAPDPEYNPPQVAKPSELRSWAHRMGARAQKAEAEIQKLHSRIAQLENQPDKDSEATSNLAQELATLKKKYEENENRLKLANYEKSDEYATRYLKPYQDAFARAYRDVKELIVYEPNPDDPDNPKERAATQADFDEIYSLDLGRANRLAKQKFGDAASIVLQHRLKVRELAESAVSAVQEYRTKAGEIETQTKAQEAQFQEGKARMFRAAVEGHAKRYPDLFAERDGDAEGNQLLARGREFAMSIFSGEEGLTPQQIAFRDGQGFNRMMVYPRLLRDNRKLKAELDEARKTIETLRGSGPGTPGGGTGKPDSSGYVPFDEAFDKLPG